MHRHDLAEHLAMSNLPARLGWPLPKCNAAFRRLKNLPFHPAKETQCPVPDRAKADFPRALSLRLAKTATRMSRKLIHSARTLATAVRGLKFPAPVAFVYHPLDYAWSAHFAYLEKFGRAPKRVLFLGMNPGPFGMTQTGVPFGEVAAVRDWLGLAAKIRKPEREHPQRPIEGFACERSEVSGQRLWGLFAACFGSPAKFFREHFVVNYCPLAFLEKSGRNLTPDKLPLRATAKLYAACDEHLRAVVEILRPEWLIGVGDFALQRAESIFGGTQLRLGKILHPSPASPAANRGWAEQAERQLRTLGVW
jgi:single-strand selective monofunctional uracil DNA glycosylase